MTTKQESRSNFECLLQTFKVTSRFLFSSHTPEYQDNLQKWTHHTGDYTCHLMWDPRPRHTCRQTLHHWTNQHTGGRGHCQNQLLYHLCVDWSSDEEFA